MSDNKGRYPKAIFCSACYFKGRYMKVDECEEHGGIGAIKTSQPPPEQSDGPDIADLVVIDLSKRKQKGIETYGIPLRAGNGRDGLMDAYEELLDAVCYLRQCIFEKEGK